VTFDPDPGRDDDASYLDDCTWASERLPSASGGRSRHPIQDHRAQAVDLLLAERRNAVAEAEEIGGDGFADALRRITTDVARYRAGTYTPPSWWFDFKYARHELDTLARTALAGPKAVALLARFAAQEYRCSGTLIAVSDVELEIDGARLFGCLLYLAGHPVSAAFWWRLAAMADDPLSAFALHLQHLLRGELHDAGWWLEEARTRTPGGQGTLPSLPDMHGYTPAARDLTTGHQEDPAVVQAAEVDSLVVHGDPGDLVDGVAGRPDRGLATRLEELASR
jgi:hypothetical protein